MCILNADADKSVVFNLSVAHHNLTTARDEIQRVRAMVGREHHSMLSDILSEVDIATEMAESMIAEHVHGRDHEEMEHSHNG